MSRERTSVVDSFLFYNRFFFDDDDEIPVFLAVFDRNAMFLA